MIDFVVPLSDVRFSAEEVEAVAGAYRSGWLSQGPRVAAFERAFAEFADSRHAIAVANGTAALHLAFAAAGLRAGDEVVLPAMTFAATAAAVIQTGATPVFADIGGDARPWLSVAATRAAIGARTAAIVNVAYAGHGGEVLALRELAQASGLLLIEDAAHAPGALADGRQVGTIGLAGTFSFFANKNLPLGEGGMLVTDDDQLARRARLLRSHGLSSDTWARHRGDEADYEVLEPGYNYRLDEPRASLGLLLLARLRRDNARRAELAAAYATALKDVDGVAPVIEPDPSATCAWHIYPLLLDEGVDRGQFRLHLRAAGIQTSVHYPPLHLTPAFASARGRVVLSATENYARRTVSVPLFPHMSQSQQLLVITAITESLRPLTRGI